MRKFGLIGYPLGHSFSKKYFTEKFKNENIKDCIYENFPLEEISLIRQLLSDEPDLIGLNVTIPYKSGVFDYLDVISPEAKEIGAVNVIKLSRHDGEVKLSGFNSDVTGIKDSIFPYVTDSNQKAVILGTGGSSRAVLHVLKSLGITTSLVSRNSKPGAIVYEDLDAEIIKSSDFIINTTPLGMYPNTEGRPPLDYKLLSERNILFDLVYNPEYTAFLEMGKKQGCTVISGLKMLYSQAEKAWEIWNDDLY